MDNNELVNKYIEKLNEEIAETTKRRIVTDAKAAVLESANEVMGLRINELESQLADLQVAYDESKKKKKIHTE